jgi:hypothetical protein
MAILSVLGIGVWSGVSVSLRIAQRVHDRALLNARLLQLDDRLRDCAGRILAPWWIEGPVLQLAEDGSWNVPWLDGDPAKKLQVAFRGGVLTIDDGSIVSRYPGFTMATLTAGLEGKTPALGMTLRVQGKNVPPLSLVVRYGSAPVEAPPPKEAGSS